VNDSANSWPGSVIGAALGVDGTAGDPRSSGPLIHDTQATEIVWLVDHGMTPAAAIRSATMVDAEMMGWQDQIDSLDKGKFADVVAVSGDPLKDISELERVKFVRRVERSIETI
jgi:imidazolonepropionase-like amidohydrolase